MGAGKQSVELHLILVMIGFSGRSPSFAIIDLLNQFTRFTKVNNCKMLQNVKKEAEELRRENEELKVELARS